MERLKLWQLPLFVVVGFVAIVALLPQSRWVLLTQGDVLAGRWRLNGSDFASSQPYVHPVSRGLRAEDPTSDETARFLKLLRPTDHSTSIDAYDQRMAALYKICERENTVEYWAQFVRANSVVGMIQEPQPNSRKVETPLRRQSKERQLAACQAGSRLEPENAFFALLESGVRYTLGDQKGSRASYLRASRLTEYQDYAEFEPALRYRYLVGRYGYRGSQQQAWILAETLLPHLTVIRTLGKHYGRSDDLEAKVASAGVARLLLQEDDSVIGLYVGRTIFLDAIGHPKPISGDPGHQEVVRLAQALESRLPGDQGLLALAVSLDRLLADLRDFRSPEGLDDVLNLRPAYSAWSFLSLLLLPLPLAFGLARTKSLRFSSAAPYLAWVMALPLEPAFGELARPAPLFGLAALLFFPALAPKLRGYTDSLGVGVAVVAAWMSLGYYPLAAPTLLFVWSLWTERRSPQLSSLTITAAAVIACLLGAAVWVMVAVKQGGANGAVFGSMAVVGALAAVPGGSPIRWGRLAGGASLTLGLLYGGMVYRDLSENRQVAVVCQELLNEAKGIREKTRAFQDRGL